MRLDTSKVDDWRELLEWLERQPFGAFIAEMPQDLKYLASPYAVRSELMIYSSRLGWRPVEGWWDELEKLKKGGQQSTGNE